MEDGILSGQPERPEMSYFSAWGAFRFRDVLKVLEMESFSECLPLGHARVQSEQGVFESDFWGLRWPPENTKRPANHRVSATGMKRGYKRFDLLSQENTDSLQLQELAKFQMSRPTTGDISPKLLSKSMSPIPNIRRPGNACLAERNSRVSSKVAQPKSAFYHGWGNKYPRRSRQTAQRNTTKRSSTICAWVV